MVHFTKIHNNNFLLWEWLPNLTLTLLQSPYFTSQYLENIKYPRNYVCGIWGQRISSLLKPLRPLSFDKHSPSLPSSISPRLFRPHHRVTSPTRCLFMYLYVYVSVYGGPKLPGTTLHMQTPVKTLLIVFYFIAITR